MSDFAAALLASSATASNCLKSTDVEASSPKSTMAAMKRASMSGSRSPQAKFVLFIETLMKYLEIEDPDLFFMAKQTIKYCTKLNRQGDVRFTPLKRAIIIRLRHLVGDIHWARVTAHFQDVFLVQQQARARRRDSLNKLDSLQLLCNRITTPEQSSSPSRADELQLLALAAMTSNTNPRNQFGGVDHTLPTLEPLPLIGRSPFSKFSLH